MGAKPCGWAIGVAEKVYERLERALAHGTGQKGQVMILAVALHEAQERGEAAGTLAMVGYLDGLADEEAGKAAKKAPDLAKIMIRRKTKRLP